MEGFDHGATDSGPEPIADFSSCCHPYGPCPSVVEAVRQADPTRYPDPSYRRLREVLGDVHGTDADRIVPGSGVSELILRMVGAVPGDVLAWSPSFVEYRRAAHVHGRGFLEASDARSWIERVPRSGVAFLCQPNNPDGSVHSRAFLDEAANECRSKGCRLVLDLAYADFCPSFPSLAEGADLLFAPNKKFGMTGIRAGLAVCADAAFAARLAARAPSWVVGAHGVAFLQASIGSDAGIWFDHHRSRVRQAWANLGALLAGQGWRTHPSDTHFLAAQPPPGSRDIEPALHSAHWTHLLRSRGIRARDLSNTGMPGWLRFAARPEGELAFLGTVLSGLDPMDPG